MRFTLHRRFAQRARRSRERRRGSDASHGFTWLPTISVGEDGSLPDGWLEWMFEAVQTGALQVPELRASHEAAVEVVQRYASDLEPFAIFLRGFDLEAVRKPANPVLGKDISFVEFVNEPSAVERVLVESLQQALPVITAANPRGRLVPPGHHRLPRLQLAEDEWHSVVTDLVQRAPIVVVEVVRLSPGLREELEVLSRTRTQRRSVLVLAAAGSEEIDRLEFQDELIREVGKPSPMQESLLADDPAVSAFSRVMWVDELVGGPIGRAPQFADLLLETGYLRGLNARDRRARNDALWLADGAARLALEGFLPEAAMSGVRALEVFIALDDVISMIGVLADLVFITAALDDSTKARESVRWMIITARRLAPVEREGLLHRFESIRNLPAVLDDLDSSDLEQELAVLFGSEPPVPGHPG